MNHAMAPTRTNARPSRNGGRSNMPQGYRFIAGASVTNGTTCAVVHTLAQIFAGFEVRHVLARERHGFAGLRVAALTRRAKVQREAAEAADLDAFTRGERIAHDLQDLLQRQLHVLGGQVLLLGRNDLDEFRLGHCLALRTAQPSRYRGTVALRASGADAPLTRCCLSKSPQSSSLEPPEPIFSFRRSPRLVPL